MTLWSNYMKLHINIFPFSGICKDQFPSQVQLSVQSRLGLSLQAGPSVTGSLRSDVARFGDIQDEKIGRAHV